MNLQYYEAARGPSEPPVADKQDADISELIAQEVAELTKPENRIFTYHKVNVAGLIYLSMQSGLGAQLLSGGPCHFCMSACTNTLCKDSLSWHADNLWPFASCHAT